MALSFRFGNIRVKGAETSSDGLEQEDIGVLSKLIDNFRFSDPAKLEFSLGRHDAVSSDSEHTSESDIEMEADWVADFHSVLDMQKAREEPNNLLKSCPQKNLPTVNCENSSTKVKNTANIGCEYLEVEVSENKKVSKLEDSHQPIVHEHKERSSTLTDICKKDTNSISAKKLLDLSVNNDSMTKAERRASRINELKEKFEVLNKKLNVTYESKIHVVGNKSKDGRDNEIDENATEPPTEESDATKDSNGKVESEHSKNTSISAVQAIVIDKETEPIEMQSTSVHSDHEGLAVAKADNSLEKKTNNQQNYEVLNNIEQSRDSLSVDVTKDPTVDVRTNWPVFKSVVEDKSSPMVIETTAVSFAETKKSILSDAKNNLSPKISVISESKASLNGEPIKQASPVPVKASTKEKKKPKVYDIQPACSFPLDDLLPAVKTNPKKPNVETAENRCDSKKTDEDKENTGCKNNYENVKSCNNETTHFSGSYQDYSTNIDNVPMECDTETHGYHPAVQTPNHREQSYHGHHEHTASAGFWPQSAVQPLNYPSNQYPVFNNLVFKADQAPMMGQNNPWAPTYQMSSPPCAQTIHNAPYLNQPSSLLQSSSSNQETAQQLSKQDSEQSTDQLNNVLLAMKYGNDVAIQRLQSALCKQIRSKQFSSVDTNTGSSIGNNFGFYMERNNPQASNETSNPREQSGKLFQLFVEQVSGLVKTEDDKTKVQSLLEVLKKEGGDRLKGTGFTPPQVELASDKPCEDISEPAGIEDNKSDVAELFEGRTLLKGGVKPRHIPKTIIYRTDKSSPTDPRPLSGKGSAVMMVKLPAFYATAWQEKTTEEKKDSSIPFNAKDPRCQKLLSEDPHKLNMKGGSNSTPDSQQSNASDSEALEKVAKVLENLKQLEKQLKEKEKNKTENKSGKEKNLDNTPIMSLSGLVTPGLTEIANKLKSPPKPITVVTGLSQSTPTLEEYSQGSSIPVIINDKTSTEPSTKPVIEQTNQRCSFLQNVKMVETAETSETKPFETERKALPFESKKQTKPSIGIVKPVQQVKKDTQEQKPPDGNNSRANKTESSKKYSQAKVDSSINSVKALSEKGVKGIDHSAPKPTHNKDLSYSDISDQELQPEDSAKGLTIGEELRHNDKRKTASFKRSSRSPGTDKRHEAVYHKQGHIAMSASYEQTQKSHSRSSDRYKPQKRSRSRSPGRQVQHDRNKTSSLQVRHYRKSSSRQSSPCYVTSAWNKQSSCFAGQQDTRQSQKRPSHSPQDYRVEQPRKRHNSREQSEKSVFTLSTRERELEELEKYRDYLLQKTFSDDRDEDPEILKHSANKEQIRHGTKYHSNVEYSSHTEKHASSKEYSRYRDANRSSKGNCTQDNKYNSKKEYSRSSGEHVSSREHSRQLEDRSSRNSDRKDRRSHRHSEERSRKEAPRQERESSVDSRNSDISRKRQHVSRGDSFHKEEKIARVEEPLKQPANDDLRSKIKSRSNRKQRGPDYSSTVSEYLMSSFYKQTENSNTSAKVNYKKELNEMHQDEEGNLSDDDYKKEFMAIFTKPKTFNDSSVTVLKGTESESCGKTLKTRLTKQKTAKQLKQDEEDRLFLESCKKKYKKFDEISPEVAAVTKRPVDNVTPVKTDASSMTARGTLDYSDLLKLPEQKDGQIS